jgi:hypothetical protein
MKILRQVSFSKKEENAKLKLGDRINMSLNYTGMKEGSDREKDERDRLKGVPSSEETKSRKRRTNVLAAGCGAAIGGAAGSKSIGESNRSAATSAAILGLVGAGSVYVGSKLGEKLEPKVLKKRKELEKTDKNYRNSWKKQEDLLDVKLGKMSKEKFVKKWGGKLNGKEIKGSMNG